MVCARHLAEVGAALGYKRGEHAFYEHPACLMTHGLWQALTSLEGGKSSAAEARACLATLWDEVRLRPLSARVCSAFVTLKIREQRGEGARVLSHAVGRGMPVPALFHVALRHDTCLQSVSSNVIAYASYVIALACRSCTEHLPSACVARRSRCWCQACSDGL